jgi:hypothetical protein
VERAILSQWRPCCEGRKAPVEGGRAPPAISQPDRNGLAFRTAVRAVRPVEQHHGRRDRSCAEGGREQDAEQRAAHPGGRRNRPSRSRTHGRSEARRPPRAPRRPQRRNCHGRRRAEGGVSSRERAASWIGSRCSGVAEMTHQARNGSCRPFRNRTPRRACRLTRPLLALK